MSKTALITGASGGIGSACAAALAQNGYNIAVHYNTNRDGAIKTMKRVFSPYLKAAAYKADLTSADSVCTMRKAVLNEFETLDTLVLCAGIAYQNLFQFTDEHTYDMLMDTNVKSAYLTIKEFLPHMIERKSGNIIIISSMWGEVGASCEVIYSAAKAALIGMTKALAKEVAPSGIRVNCITPGVILTNMVEPLGEDTLNELANETPLGRNGVPEDVANTVSWLASEQSSFITGQIIGVNGGLVI
jgi:3-oxoacyl-[acyl-carrier protein] reductase